MCVHRYSYVKKFSIAIGVIDNDGWLARSAFILSLHFIFSRKLRESSNSGDQRNKEVEENLSLQALKTLN